MAESARLSLNLYLVKPDVAAARAAPDLISATAEDGGVLDLESDHQQESLEEPEEDEAGWVDTWIVQDGTLERSPLPTERDGRAALAVRATPGSPAWLNLLTQLAPGTRDTPGHLNFGALFFQPIGPELVVWSFGTGWMLIDKSTTVDRFGLRTGLNALLSTPPPDGVAVGVRELTSAIRASVTRRATVSTSRPSKPTSIERVDRTSDGATMAALATGHPTFGRIEAGRSLRFDATVGEVWDLTRYATQAVRLHRRTDYQSNDEYSWIDFTVPVSDPDEIDRVLDALWVQATSTTPPLIDALWADSDPNTGVAPRTLRFPHERQADERITLTWALARDWLLTQSPANGREALRTELRFFDDPSGTAMVKAPLWWHLVAQFDVDENTYVVSDGEIWRASTSYLDDLNDTLASSVVVNPSNLPLYALGESEGDYNDRAAVHGSHLLIDKSLLRLGGQTAIEAGDLLSADGCLMHVKRRARSSTLSHVTAQALGAAQLLRSSADARHKLDTMLCASTPAPVQLEAMRNHCASFGGSPTATVQVVIVGDWRGVPDVARLPLLTRLNLAAWLRQMPCNREIVLVGT